MQMFEWMSNPQPFKLQLYVKSQGLHESTFLKKILGLHLEVVIFCTWYTAIFYTPCDLVRYQMRQNFVVLHRPTHAPFFHFHKQEILPFCRTFINLIHRILAFWGLLNQKQWDDWQSKLCPSTPTSILQTLPLSNHLQNWAQWASHPGHAYSTVVSARVGLKLFKISIVLLEND